MLSITETYVRDEYQLPPDRVWGVIEHDFARVALHPDDPRFEAVEPARVRADCLFIKGEKMKIKGIVWLGTRTDRFDQMTDFCRDLLGLAQRLSEPGFAVYELPNGDLFEVFGPDSSFNEFMTHPVAGFLVDDIVAARAEMEARGIEFIGPIEGDTDDYKWTHFRAPDGFVYELTYSTAHPSIAE